MLIFYHVTSCYRNTKCGNTTKTKLIKKKYQRKQLGKLLKHLNVFVTEKSEDFMQEQRINQLSAPEFEETRVRHKFGTCMQSVALCDVKAILMHTPLRSCAKPNSTFVSILHSQCIL